jgi:hypothetical protein
MNQTKAQRGKGLQSSIINDEIFKQATDEETNYMRFIINEMKPNYNNSGVNQQTTLAAIQSALIGSGQGQPAGAPSLNQDASLGLAIETVSMKQVRIEVLSFRATTK